MAFMAFMACAIAIDDTRSLIAVAGNRLRIAEVTTGDLQQQQIDDALEQ